MAVARGGMTHRLGEGWSSAWEGRGREGEGRARGCRVSLTTAGISSYVSSAQERRASTTHDRLMLQKKTPWQTLSRAPYPSTRMGGNKEKTHYYPHRRHHSRRYRRTTLRRLVQTGGGGGVGGGGVWGGGGGGGGHVREPPQGTYHKRVLLEWAVCRPVLDQHRQAHTRMLRKDTSHCETSGNLQTP